MKNFFSNKLNVFLSILLVAVLGLAVYLVMSIMGISFSKSVTAIDFTGYSKSQVEQWVSENKLKDGVYSYTYEYSSDVEKDYVIYQSVKADDKITDSLIMIYSNGADPNGEVKLPSLTGATSEEEIESWLNQNEFTNVTYLYEVSDTHEFGSVISISPSQAKKSDAITVTVSLGEDIKDISTEVPDFSTYTKAQIERWANKYGITLDLKYESSNSISEDGYISQSIKAGNAISGGEDITVTLSSGKSDGSEVFIDETAYLGLSETDFISKLKALGFNNLSKSSTTYYSENLKEGTIYYYEDGTFKTSRTINYALCAGAYKFDATEFNGLTKTKAESKIADLKARNARVSKTLLSILFETGDTNADKANQTYDCSISGAKISCKVYSNGESAYIDETKYLGVKEEAFLSDLKTLGYTNFTKSETTYYSTKLASGTIYSYDDGNIALSKSINYALSIGPYTFNASDFNGLSQSAAQSKADDYKKRNARLNGSLISIKFTNGDSSGTKGNTYDCTASGSTISCKVYGGSTSVTTQYINPTGYLGVSESNFISALNKLGFTSLNKESTTYYSTTLAQGTIYSYTPDGNVKTDQTITYGLSAGKYTFIASNYNGLSQSAAQNKVNDEVNRNAKVNGNKISISFINGTSGGTAGNTYDCGMSGSVISCKVYTSGGTTNTSVNVVNYEGQSADSLESWASSNGLSTSASKVYSDTVEAGKVISQSPNSGSVNKGSTIYYEVSLGKEPSSDLYIMSSDLVKDRINNNSAGSYDNAYAEAKDIFSGFSNVTIKGEASSMTVGRVISITVNGSSTYSEGYYDSKTTEIVVTICNKTSY